MQEMNDIKVLLVEDDPSLRMIICETLELEGFSCICAEDGMDGLQKFYDEMFDVIVADIMMPKLDGLGMVIRMRQRNRHVPILFLTAKSSVENVIEGFEAGADDYLRKPFSMKELIVRIQALHTRANSLRRSPSDALLKPIAIGNYLFDPVSQFLSFHTRTDKLSSKESELLYLLSKHINEVVSANFIMKELWFDDSYSVANSLQVFITKLRQRLKDDPYVRIVNARGVGYKLVVDIPRDKP